MAFMGFERKQGIVAEPLCREYFRLKRHKSTEITEKLRVSVPLCEPD